MGESPTSSDVIETGGIISCFSPTYKLRKSEWHQGHASFADLLGDTLCLDHVTSQMTSSAGRAKKRKKRVSSTEDGRSARGYSVPPPCHLTLAENHLFLV